MLSMPSSDAPRLARLWRNLHGDEAVALARDMVTELEEAGNAAGADLWQRVIIEIEKLGGAEGK